MNPNDGPAAFSLKSNHFPMLRTFQTVENILLFLTAQLSNCALYGKTPLYTCIAGCGLDWEQTPGLRCRALSSRHSAVNSKWQARNNITCMPGSEPQPEVFERRVV